MGEIFCICGEVLVLGRAQIPDDKQSARDAYRAVRTSDDADEEGEGEVADDLAAPDVHRDDRKQRRERGVDGTRERLVDGPVHEFVNSERANVGPVFPDAVEDDYRVVQRVTRDGEDGRDEGYGNFLPGKAVRSEHYYYVVHQRSDGDRAETEAEAIRHVDEYRGECEGERPDGLHTQLSADDRS